MKKKLLMLTVIIAICATTLAFAGGFETITGDLRPDVTIMMDGEEIVYTDVNDNTVVPIIIDGTTYLPIRGLMESIGKDVDWDNDTNSIIITSPVVEEPEKAPAIDEDDISDIDETDEDAIFDDADLDEDVDVEDDADLEEDAE